MLKFTKRFSGSYVASLVNGEYINVQSYDQYTGCEAQDSKGNKWVTSYSDDFNGDNTLRFKTKREAVSYANELVTIL